MRVSGSLLHKRGAGSPCFAMISKQNCAMALFMTSLVMPASCRRSDSFSDFSQCERSCRMRGMTRVSCPQLNGWDIQKRISKSRAMQQCSTAGAAAPVDRKDKWKVKYGHVFVCECECEGWAVVEPCCKTAKQQWCLISLGFETQRAPCPHHASKQFSFGLLLMQSTKWLALTWLASRLSPLASNCFCCTQQRSTLKR